MLVAPLCLHYTTHIHTRSTVARSTRSTRLQCRRIDRSWYVLGILVDASWNDSDISNASLSRHCVFLGSRITVSRIIITRHCQTNNRIHNHREDSSSTYTYIHICTYTYVYRWRCHVVVLQQPDCSLFSRGTLSFDPAANGNNVSGENKSFERIKRHLVAKICASFRHAVADTCVTRRNLSMLRLYRYK